MIRRNFLNTMGRLTLFGALTVVSALAITKGKHPENGKCTVSKFCQNCGLLTDCDLPDAITEKDKSIIRNS